MPEPVAAPAAPPALPAAIEAPRWLAAGFARPQPVTPPVGQAAPAEPSILEDGLAQALRSRREALDERERLLAMREAVVAAAEQRLQARLDQLAGLQARLEENERQTRLRDDAHWASLAKLYETMRPREAALVFNELDLPLLAQIVNRMREQKAAPVFGAMEPERVRALTAELARMRAARPGL
ncbi:MotE family protein [Pseudoroseomonas cervicalis]|uniref:MotE family protein n=1 Tax=Teichococcus cervicalis TaxID=204525 RepID=UPI0035E8C22C